MLERWRAWLDDRPFQERGVVNLSQTSWRQYESALDEALQDPDPVHVARYLGTLARWQIPEAVAKLYEILETYERALERGDITERPLVIYNAVQTVVGMMREPVVIDTLFQCVYEGRAGRARTPNLTARVYLYRGMTRSVDTGVNRRIAEGASHEEFSVRVAMCDILAERGVEKHADDEYRAVLGLLEDAVRPVQSAAIKALVSLANRSEPDRFLAIIEDLVGAFFDASGTIKQDLYEALKAITGEDLGMSHHRYALWMNAYRQAVREGRADREVDIPAGGDQDPGDDYAEPPPTYFGEEILAHQIVFILDRSQSMMEPAGQRRRDPPAVHRAPPAARRRHPRPRRGRGRRGGGGAAALEQHPDQVGPRPRGCSSRPSRG